MLKKDIVSGISAVKEDRVVAEIVSIANTYRSRIYFETESKVINAKSIMGMMTLNLLAGNRVSISIEGEDENKAMEAIENFLLGR
ncbi:MAG: HPr family phosphocarrier protein [Lachnospiraceae bacterium]|nr:HPr family phosphocarrier protein [Lachnospiraceae bacterium]